VANVEADLISAVCLNKDIHVVLQSDTDVLFRSHKDIFNGLKSYYQKYRSVPDVEILEKRFNNFESTKVSAQTQFYLDQLRDDYIASNLRSILLSSGSALKTDSGSRVLEKIQKSISDLSGMSNVVKDLDLTDYKLAQKHFDSVRQMTNEFGGTPGIKTGIKSIDAVYPTGFGPGHLAYLIGYTGRSKTFFSMLLASKAFEQGFSPMFISLEMSPQDVRDRVYGLMGEGVFRISSLQKGFVDADALENFGKTTLGTGPKFTVISNEGKGVVTPAVISSKITEYNPDIIFVDYIQLMSDNGKTRNMTERFTNATHELKQLAMSSNKPIVAISAVTNDENHSDETPPRLNQVAWSKAISYDADISISVHKHTDTNIIELFVEKNRRGSQANVFLKCDLDIGKIEETFDEDLLNLG
jgi:replicative DNA helicase